MPISSETIESRKAALVAAARVLIREKGGASFSMRELALKAGVSTATPYNLISTKANLLTLVLEQEFREFRGEMAPLAKLGGLERLLNTIDLLCSHYASDQKFYFGLFKSAGTIDESSMALVMLEGGRALFGDMVRAAIAEEDEGGGFAAALVTGVLLRTMRATVEAWYVSGWSVARFHDEMAFAVRVVMMANYRGPVAESLRRELTVLQERLEKHASAEPFAGALASG
ncbi:MAG: TetR/AcrR family transcriptional regulator [Alphaproteobacteria bacterium HGW-Alphaproteobacteria-13]|jgi:AcrR family transcriptional regulator|nr:MAG: TetR/AcrR family transcriptional regulator [Alphaproteobacteria bacterium HGW-Alphaproteobacteria-13]